MRLIGAVIDEFVLCWFWLDALISRGSDAHQHTVRSVSCNKPQSISLLTHWLSVPIDGEAISSHDLVPHTPKEGFLAFFFMSVVSLNRCSTSLGMLPLPFLSIFVIDPNVQSSTSALELL